MTSIDGNISTRINENTSTSKGINGMNHIYYESRYQECMDGAMRNDKEK